MVRTVFAYWPVLLLTLWSCRKDVEEFQPYAPTAQAIGRLLAEQIPNPTTHTTFSLNYLSTDKVLETPGGIRIFLIDTDHLFSKPGSAVPVLCSTCADLKIEVTEVLDKRDIVARGLNTIDEGGSLFESGGMVRVTASCDGQTLTLLPDRNLKIQLPNNNAQSDFFVYNQFASAGTDAPWIKSNQAVFEAEWPLANGPQKGYEMLIKNLGWAACGRPLTDPASLFCIALPIGFADQNTLAYLVFKNQQVVVPLQFDLGQNKFCYPKVPVGFQVQLMAVSKLGSQYWLGKAETEIGTSATFQLGTQQMTEEAVLNFVKGL